MNIDNGENKLLFYYQKAKEAYEKQDGIFCPYFSLKVVLNADGFNHLQYKTNRMPRPVQEQIYKLSLTSKALSIISKSGTVQEYRNTIEKVGKMRSDGFFSTKRVQYWGFIALLENNSDRIKVILKKIGEGEIMFWSTMLLKGRSYSGDISTE